ncbi:hypothetical protein SNQ28_000626 [Cronobacter malonaticus]|nr:hypothetical protein [Cronobacter malonaticus]ELY6256612.1 hypothetical protein [Cronobacter malonaticus]
MNNDELIAAGHELAKCLDNEPLIDIAKMIARLADKLDGTTAALREKTKQCEKLAEENGQMLRLLTDISENHDEYVNQDEYLYAGVPMDYVSEINSYVSRDVEAENPFKATDAFLREVKAQGAENAAAYIKISIQHLPEDHRVAYHDAIELCSGAAALLRKGGAA